MKKIVLYKICLSWLMIFHVFFPVLFFIYYHENVFISYMFFCFMKDLRHIIMF